jgi:catechol 2,3-dioxygenase-like lactoylglutathione lyase family enzyme
MPNLRTDHLAFPSFDAVATHRFYTHVMGFPLVHAQSGASSTWKKSYLLTAYAIGDGRSIDFFEYDGIARPTAGEMPEDIQHVGFAVPSSADFEAWKQRLDRHDVRWYTEDHGDDVHLYFRDPNGILFEISLEEDTLAAKPSTSKALDVVQRWARDRGRELE